MHDSKSTTNKGHRLDTILSNWPDMPIKEKPILLKTFSSGLNHQTHLISSNDKKTVLKLFSKPSSSAIEIQKFAAKHQLSPHVLYTNPNYDVALMEYINSSTISQPINSQDLKLLGSALKKLHSLPNKLVENQTGRFDLLGYYETYLDEVGANDSLTQSIHQRVLPIINTFLKDETPWCVCHNDLVKENCFITDNRGQFIDWEYAQLNNPLFDLATLIYTLDLNDDQTAFLICAYQPAWLEKISKHVFISAQCAMLWCDILWHLARGQNLQLPELKKKIGDLKNLETNFNRTA